MKILDIIALSRQNKTLAILTPNHIEAKLLFDRFLFEKIEGLRVCDSNKLILNDSCLIFVTPETAHTVTADHVIVEFFDSIPEHTLFGIQQFAARDFTFLPMEIY